MAAKPSQIILDTNVLMDNLMGDRSSAGASRRAIDIAREAEMNILYTAEQARQVYYLTGTSLKRQRRTQAQKLSHSEAAAINEICWAALDEMDSYATVVASDASDVWIAKKLRSIHNDFEDNLVIAAAMRVKADYIVTNDEALIKHSPVAAITPEDFVKLIEAFEED